MTLREDPVAHIRFINPDGLVRPPTYTQVVEVVGPGRTIYISGQLGTDRDGKLAAGDFRAQAEQVFKNLQAALAAVGAGFADIVKLTSYLMHITDLPALRDVRARHLNPEALPASTTLEVAKFARKDALLEIEAVAVLPPARARNGKPAARGKLRAAPRTKT